MRAIVVLVAMCSWFVSTAFAHGGLSMDEDYCKLRVGRYVMHFTGYQPDSPEATKEFCEDIPSTGNTIIVLDYIDDALRDLPTSVRIIKNTGDETDLNAITVFHLPPKVYPTGSLSLEYNFDRPGAYVGLVSVGDRQQFVSRFPFSVGKTRGLMLQVLTGIVPVIALAVALYWFGQRQRGRRTKAPV